VDITVHAVRSKGEQNVLAEATERVGGEYGSTFVDAAFERMLMRKLGLHPSAYDVWAKAHPDEYYVLMSRWEVTKCCFAKDTRGTAGAIDETSLVTAVRMVSLTDGSGHPAAASVRPIKIHNGFLFPILPHLNAIVTPAVQGVLKHTAGGRGMSVVLSTEEMVGLFSEVTTG
jgi:hypothetical protein